MLLPKFAYDESDYPKSYWVKQYIPELLPKEESHTETAEAADPAIADALARIKAIEAYITNLNLGR